MKLFATALFFLSLTADATAQPPDVILKLYLQANSIAMRGGATAADIERVLGFYTDDVVYEDPKVKVRIEGKEGIRSGMLSHIEDYAGTKTQVSVDKSVSLANAIAAIISEVFSVNDTTGPREVRRKRLKVIEFSGEKICRVIDYH